MKKIFLIFALLAALLGAAVSAFAATSSSVVDSAGLLQPVDRQKLNSAIRTIEQKYNVRVAVLTLKQIPDGVSISQYARAVQERYYTDGTNGNMLLLIDIGTRRWQIVTDRKMDRMITQQGGIKAIQNEMVPLLKSNNFSGAVSTYASRSNDLLAYYAKEKQAYDPANDFNGGALAGGGIMSLGFAGAVKKWLVGQMSNVQPATSAGNYFNASGFALTSNSSDTYLYTTTAVVPKPKRVSGGGGRGGFSGGRGGFSGGGGGSAGGSF